MIGFIKRVMYSTNAYKIPTDAIDVPVTSSEPKYQTNAMRMILRTTPTKLCDVAESKNNNLLL